MRPDHIFIIILLLSSFNGCGGSVRSTNGTIKPANAAETKIFDDAATAERAIRDLEYRIKRDPEDMIAYNMLAGRYLQRLRETGNFDYLQLAERAVKASLKVLPPEHNPGGLSALAEVEFASHNFVAARNHAEQLAQLAPNKIHPYEIIGDALLELGEYDKASAIFRKMEKLIDGSINSSISLNIRLSRLAVLQGKNDKAQAYLSDALAQLHRLSPQPREITAWCNWQLGENAFAMGAYDAAERHYNHALTIFPDYFRAQASLARIKAARGDLQAAIELYRRAVQTIPDLSFVAALGDLYKLAGREREANAQYALAERIGRLNELNGTLYNRNLALFYADHNLKADEAYTNAAREYQVRRDIYGADALAWTALKAGRVTEAQSAIREALRLGTNDAKLFYHAGMIALVAGDRSAARDYLMRALKLNEHFDPLQATIAKKMLAEIAN